MSLGDIHLYYNMTHETVVNLHYYMTELLTSNERKNQWHNLAPALFTPVTIFMLSARQLFEVDVVANYFNTNTQYIYDLYDNYRYRHCASYSNLVDSTLYSFNDWMSFTADIVGTDLHSNVYNSFSDLREITKQENNYEEISNIFPELDEELMVFEELAISTDGSYFCYLDAPAWKLHYPEPFIASPSFVHEELFFMHILHFQHWLWFMFISLIMLYFITFMNVSRWCNPRTRPRRETRGVSRSKCADMITAIVPVSWAISIIVSETVDATDYYDGFGTTEIVISIRAAQWNWKYYFPRNTDTSFFEKTYNSLSTGNSLKYTRTSEGNSHSNKLWEAFKSKNTSKLTSSPIHLILSPSDNNKILDFSSKKSLGSSTLQSSGAFSKIKFFSKINNQELFNSSSEFTLKYNKLSNLYNNNSNLTNTGSYGTYRQHNFNSLNSVSNMFTNHIDEKAISISGSWNVGNKGWAGPTTGPNQPASEPSTLLNKAVPEQNLVVDKFGELTLSQITTTSLPKVLDTKLGTPVSLNHLLSNPSGRTSYRDTLEIYKPLSDSLDIKSSSELVGAGEKSVRDLSIFHPSKPNLTFNNNPDLINQAVNNPTTFPYTHTPSTFTSLKLPSLSFDKFNSDNVVAKAVLLSSELTPNYTSNTYWNSVWAKSNTELRLNLSNLHLDLISQTSLPTITTYIDYDFRDRKALEMVEDSLWEAGITSYTYEDYINSVKNIEESILFQKPVKVYNKLIREWGESTTGALDQVVRGDSLYVYADEEISNARLLNPNNFNGFANDVDADSSEDAYENTKQVSYVHNNHYYNNLVTDSNYNNPASYAQVLNDFRANNDDTEVGIDSPRAFNGLLSDDTNLVLDKDLRLSNPLKLTSTAKNSINTYRSLQKVFRPRYDEGRTNARLQDISHSYLKYPFLSENKTKYESLLGKNRESFYNLTSYNVGLTTNYSSLHDTVNSLNIYFSDIPFFLSNNSDSSRNLWFDWHSRWNWVEVAPSSVARYSLTGLPYLRKTFEYSSDTNQLMSDSENYLLKLLKARKNYMSNWALTPYLYSRISSWYTSNDLFSSLFGKPTLHDLRVNLEIVSGYDSEPSSMDVLRETTPSFNQISTPGRSSWQPNVGTQGFNYNISILTNLLTKREYLYREYFANKNYTINLPKFILSSPSNPLFEEVKASYALIDPSSFSPEVSREFIYQNNSFTKLNLLRDFLGKVSQVTPITTPTSLNLSALTNQLLYHFFTLDDINHSNYNTGLFKNQYRPMRKGVTNMIRLHVTGAIAMPIETRLHILASSKDVIHSWAIPSAGIKIDCVPGFSTHRVTIFLVSGTFWGQCMEICGRFHHWMPIVVYFMKRDLFFLWCTHFIHYSPNDSSYKSSDINLANNLKQASYHPDGWLSEVLKSL